MSHISRRTWLKGLGLFSVVAGNALMLVFTAAEAKASKQLSTTATPLKGCKCATCASTTSRAAADAAGWEACAWMAVP
jgi:hypothetical protein